MQPCPRGLLVPLAWDENHEEARDSHSHIWKSSKDMALRSLRDGRMAAVIPAIRTCLRMVWYLEEKPPSHPDDLSSLQGLSDPEDLSNIPTKKPTARVGAVGQTQVTTGNHTRDAFGIFYHACILAYVFSQFSNDSKQTQIYISIFSSPQFDSDPVWRLPGFLPMVKLVCGTSIALSSPMVLGYF